MFENQFFKALNFWCISLIAISTNEAISNTISTPESSAALLLESQQEEEPVSHKSNEMDSSEISTVLDTPVKYLLRYVQNPKRKEEKE